LFATIANHVNIQSRRSLNFNTFKYGKGFAAYTEEGGNHFSVKDE